MSPEATSLIALDNERHADAVKPGDMYTISDGRLHFTMLILGHKRRGRWAADGHTFVWLYNMGERSLRTSPPNLRDCDANACQAEAWLHDSRRRGHRVTYCGNVYDYVPPSSVATV